MAYVLSNVYTKITGIDPLLLKLSLVVGWRSFFLRHSIEITSVTSQSLAMQLLLDSVCRFSDAIPLWSQSCKRLSNWPSFLSR